METDRREDQNTSSALATAALFSAEQQANLDQKLMAAAIRLARRHEGLTADNPSVGALIVRFDEDGPTIIGRGVTAPGGRPHAEVQALNEAGNKARGACAYVTLEPCSHFGKTPPCAQALIKAGIARVVVAAFDPDKRVSGKGFETLRQAGIEVVEGVMADDAELGLSGFLMRVANERPFVTLKMAISIDGKMGVQSGRQVKITGPISNGQVHVLRAINDAILIGSGTALNDDPSLTCRLEGLTHRSPTRIILDRRLRLSARSNLVQTVGEVKTILATTSDNEILPALEKNGIEVIDLGQLNANEQLGVLLHKLATKDMSTLLVEGGAGVAQSFLDADLVDRLMIFQAPDKLKIEAEEEPVPAPLTPENMRTDFTLRNRMTFGRDVMYDYRRIR